MEESITLRQFNGGTFFTSTLHDVLLPVASERAAVSVSALGETLFSEILYAVDGFVTLSELGQLLEPYARKHLALPVTIACTTDDGSTSGSGTVLYAMADVGIDASNFYLQHFLTILDGEKVTALGRRETLWYYGTNEPACVTAHYDSGDPKVFTDIRKMTESSTYTCIDVSPGNFVDDEGGRVLCGYTVEVGSTSNGGQARTQRFTIDHSRPDCAPILEFCNSFGVWELIYCTGTHGVDPEYKRSTTRLGGRLCQYRVETTRHFKADTGPLTTAMASWADELLCSPEVYVVNVEGGEVSSRGGGRPVVITESKSPRSNDDGAMPRFTFTYQYAQRIHTVLQLGRVGRVFDNTFDGTFD